MQKTVIGSEEWCQFPTLGLPAIKARVDSGARTSSIHAFNIQPFKRSGQRWISFEIHPLQHNRRTSIRCEAPVVDRRIVKSSSGIGEKRYVIQTVLEIGQHRFEIELTLANRDSMGYRMLLGREAMSGRMLVDPSSSFLLGDYSNEMINKLYGRKPGIQNGLRIGLLASNPELYSNRRLMEAGEERGHQMYFYNIRQCYMKVDSSTPEIHYRGGLLLNELDAVIPRIRPVMTYYGCALTRHFENLNIFALNSSSAISQSRDKLYSLQMLQRSGLDIPTTGFASSPIEPSDLIDMVGGAPLIMKLLEESSGRALVLAETRKAAESVINVFKSLNANLLVQEFIKEAQGRDLRCLVIDGRVIVSIERVAAAGEFRADIHRGGSARPVRLSQAERSLAIRAVKTLGLQVAAVDIIRSAKGPLLLEVNSSPGLEGIETATGKDIAGAMIHAIEKKLGWQKSSLGLPSKTPGSKSGHKEV